MIKVSFPIKGLVTFDKSNILQFTDLGCQKGLVPYRKIPDCFDTGMLLMGRWSCNFCEINDIKGRENGPIGIHELAIIIRERPLYQYLLPP